MTWHCCFGEAFGTAGGNHWAPPLAIYRRAEFRQGFRTLNVADAYARLVIDMNTPLGGRRAAQVQLGPEMQRERSKKQIPNTHTRPIGVQPR
jgi:hypothetical protein